MRHWLDPQTTQLSMLKGGNTKTSLVYIPTAGTNTGQLKGEILVWRSIKKTFNY